jgi:hypothetical protein
MQTCHLQPAGVVVVAPGILLKVVLHQHRGTLAGEPDTDMPGVKGITVAVAVAVPDLLGLKQRAMLAPMEGTDIRLTSREQPLYMPPAVAAEHTITMSGDTADRPVLGVAVEVRTETEGTGLLTQGQAVEGLVILFMGQLRVLGRLVLSFSNMQPRLLTRAAGVQSD